MTQDHQVILSHDLFLEHISNVQQIISKVREKMGTFMHRISHGMRFKH